MDAAYLLMTLIKLNVALVAPAAWFSYVARLVCHRSRDVCSYLSNKLQGALACVPVCLCVPIKFRRTCSCCLGGSGIVAVLELLLHDH